jgi:hypothetical protein
VLDEPRDRVHYEDVVLDIGDGVGALIIYTAAELRGREIEVTSKGANAAHIHTDVHERLVGGRTVFTAIFPALSEGEYTIWNHAPMRTTNVTIVGGQVAEVDWR